MKHLKGVFFLQFTAYNCKIILALCLRRPHECRLGATTGFRAAC